MHRRGGRSGYPVDATRWSESGSSSERSARGRAFTATGFEPSILRTEAAPGFGAIVRMSLQGDFMTCPIRAPTSDARLEPLQAYPRHISHATTLLAIVSSARGLNLCRATGDVTGKMGVIVILTDLAARRLANRRLAIDRPHRSASGRMFAGSNSFGLSNRGGNASCSRRARRRAWSRAWSSFRPGASLTQD
jgi:hypothetical protein